MSATVPPEAIAAAVAQIEAALSATGTTSGYVTWKDLARCALIPAVPLIAAAERERICQLVTGDEFVRKLCTELDDEDALDAIQAVVDLLREQVPA